MTPSLDNSWGAVSFPLPVTNGTDFTAADPAKAILLDLFAAALSYELGPMWGGTFTDAGLLNPVGSKLEVLDDIDAMRQRKTCFPLLSVSRSVEPNQEDEFTLWENRITSKWTIDYVLGPLDVGNQAKYEAVLAAAAKVISATIVNGGHRSYAAVPSASGTQLAKQVFFAGGCGFSTATVTTFIMGAAAFSQGGAKYHALTMTMQSTELDSIADESVAYNGASIGLGTGNVDGVIPNLVNLDTAIPVQPG